MIRKIKNYIHFFEALLANAWYRYPSRDMIVIGVTGTDGKTTTATFIAQILSACGYKVAVITTVGVTIDKKFYETGFHTTTPSSFFLQKYLSYAKKAKCTHVILETTSHALDQHRTLGIQFDIGIITNITHEHLDYHKTFEKYVYAKSRLLSSAKIPILNYDDDSYSLLLRHLSHKKIYRYSLKHKDSVVPKTILPVHIQSLGVFNMQNALAAASVAKLLSISDKQITDALATCKLPEGRMEVIHDDEFRVIVDFAHTPNAFENLLFELKTHTKGRLIHVFGAAGKRDTSKRKLMGEKSNRYADIIVLTAEDPRGENVSDICWEIAKGFSRRKQIEPTLIQEKDSNYFVIIPDRKQAIQFAILQASKNDSVVITGKGHEKSMNIIGTEIPWSDSEITAEILDTNTK